MIERRQMMQLVAGLATLRLAPRAAGAQAWPARPIRTCRANCSK
jgi:hypothetical protein